MIDIYGTLAGINPRLPWPGMLVLLSMAAMAAILLVVPAGSGARWVRPATRWCVVILGVLAAAQMSLAIAYLFYPRYLDWIEPTIVAAAWIGWRGGHYYPLLDSGDITGVWYGPVLFHLNGLMLWLFGPSLASSKLLGVAAFIGAQLLSVKVLLRAGASRGEALAITFVQCLVQSGFAAQGNAFGVRTDPLLLLAAEGGAFIALSNTGYVNAVLLGALIGLCGNLKIHGVFFIFPIFMVFICRAATPARQARLFLAATLAGLVSLVLPFAPEAAAPERYLGLFGMSKHFAIDKWVLEKNLVYLAMLWSPILWLYAVFRPKLPPVMLWFVAASVPAMGLVTVAASIEGGGSYNYLAFLPGMAWLLLRLLQAIRAQQRDVTGAAKLRRVVLGALVAFLTGFTPNLAAAWHAIANQAATLPRMRQARLQIEAQMRRDPMASLEVGPGPYADLRVLPVFAGHPLAIDSESWYDQRMGGIGEERIRRLIRACRIDVWMLPADEPIFFEMIEPKLYSPDFVTEFRAHYRREASGGVLDAWRCIRKDD